MRKALRHVTAVFLLTAGMFAQQLSETIEVRVANVDVVVTGRDGHPIPGLTKDDFELYENRKLQPITNFYEVRGDAPSVENAPATAPASTPSEMRRRSVIVFIDNSSIDPLRRNQAIDAAIGAVGKLLRPGDDAMLVAWNQRPQVLQPFTTDAESLKRALENARTMTAAASSIGWQRNEVLDFTNGMMAAVRAGRMRPADAYSQSVSKARSYAEWLRSMQHRMLGSLTQMISTVSGVEGKKVLIFVGGELQERPGLDVFQMVDSQFLSMSRTTIMPAGIRELDLNLSGDLKSVASSANANGVTMYMIDVADRSGTAGEGSLQNPPDPEVEFAQQVNTYTSMGRLAWDTGGSVLSGSSNFPLMLDNIARDLGSYYSLGYKPPVGASPDRTIVVKVKRHGAAARARRAVTLKSADQQMEERVIANAFHPAFKGDFPVTIATSSPERFEKGLFKIRVTLMFPSQLTYLPDGENLAGEYAAFFVTAGKDGSLSPVARQVRPVRFPAADAEAVKQKPFTHTTGMIVGPGLQSISVVILDRFGARVGYARASVTAR